jgi:hypothetical protein
MVRRMRCAQRGKRESRRGERIGGVTSSRHIAACMRNAS